MSASCIGEQFGAEYLPEKPNFYASGQRAQEAHEAIRPTDVDRTPDSLMRLADRRAVKLYELIWQRFVACQMTPGRLEGHRGRHRRRHRRRRRPSSRPSAARWSSTASCASRACHADGDQILPPLAAGSAGRPASTDAHAALHPAAAAIHRGLAGQGPRGRGHRPAQHLRHHHPDHPGPRLRRAARPPLPRHRPGQGRHRQAGQALPRHHRRPLHRPHGGSARQDRGRQPGLGTPCSGTSTGPSTSTSSRPAKRWSTPRPRAQPSEYVCETCGKPMVYRFTKNGRYLACSGYPDCKTTAPWTPTARKC